MEHTWRKYTNLLVSKTLLKMTGKSSQGSGKWEKEVAGMRRGQQ
jgi:hypothetical protein